MNIRVNPEVIRLEPLSDQTLSMIYAGLQIPNLAALQSMIREIRKARGVKE